MGRASRRDCRGFTLIELIASITIVAILAAVALPRTTAARPFSEQGYAAALAASARQARAVAIASGCAVQFTSDNAGYRALQRAAGANNHCTGAGGFTTPVRDDADGDLYRTRPTDIAAVPLRRFVFEADGSVLGAPYTINIGPYVITVDASGLVTRS